MDGGGMWTSGTWTLEVHPAVHLGIRRPVGHSHSVICYLMMAISRQIMLAAVLLCLVSCNDATAPDEGGSEYGILFDRASVEWLQIAAVPGFAFLPPLGEPVPAESGADASLLAHLAVEVCEGAGPNCNGSVLERFGPDGSGAERLRFDEQDGHYSVVWNTRGSGLDLGDGFTIRVLAGGTLLGSYTARIAVGNSSIMRNYGVAVPIHFRVSRGTVHIATPEGGSIASADRTVVLDIPAGAVTEPVGILIRPSEPALPQEEIVSGTVYEFEPDGYEFSAPVALTIAYDSVLVPYRDDGVSVVMAHLTPDGAELTPGGEWNREAQSVTGSILHFSSYGAMAAGITFTDYEEVSLVNEAGSLVCGGRWTLRKLGPRGLQLTWGNSAELVRFVDGQAFDSPTAPSPAAVFRSPLFVPTSARGEYVISSATAESLGYEWTWTYQSLGTLNWELFGTVRIIETCGAPPPIDPGETGDLTGTWRMAVIHYCAPPSPVPGTVCEAYNDDGVQVSELVVTAGGLTMEGGSYNLWEDGHVNHFTTGITEQADKTWSGTYVVSEDGASAVGTGILESATLQSDGSLHVKRSDDLAPLTYEFVRQQ